MTRLELLLMGPPQLLLLHYPVSWQLQTTSEEFKCSPSNFAGSFRGYIRQDSRYQYSYPGARREPVAPQMHALVLNEPLYQKGQLLDHNSLTYTDKRYQLASGPGPGEQLEWAAYCVAPYLPALWQPLEYSWNTSIALNSAIYSTLLSCSMSCGASAVVLGI
jgi:hypothetical protein